jgi:hypothetical protein
VFFLGFLHQLIDHRDITGILLKVYRTRCDTSDNVCFDLQHYGYSYVNLKYDTMNVNAGEG